MPNTLRQARAVSRGHGPGRRRRRGARPGGVAVPPRHRHLPDRQGRARRRRRRWSVKAPATSGRSCRSRRPGTIGGGAQSLWLTALRNNDIKAHTIGLFAVCGYRPAGYQTVRKDVVVPAVRLPPRHRHVPGRQGRARWRLGASSARARGDFRTRIQESAPGTIGGGAQSLWLTAISANLDRAQHTIGLHAVCASAPLGYQVVRKDYTVKPRRASCATRRPAPRARSSSAAARASSAPARATSTPACRSSPRAPSARRPPCSWPRCATTRRSPARSASTPSARARSAATRSIRKDFPTG